MVGTANVQSWQMLQADSEQERELKSLAYWQLRSTEIVVSCAKKYASTWSAEKIVFTGVITAVHLLLRPR